MQSAKLALQPLPCTSAHERRPTCIYLAPTAMNDRATAAHWSGQCMDALLHIEQVLASSLGPHGQHKLLVTSNKQTLCTSRGLDILRTLSPQHPLLATAAKAVETFATQHGDGSKRLMLQVLAGLREARNHLNTNSNTGPAAARLCQGLAALQGFQQSLSALIASQLHTSFLSHCPDAQQPALPPHYTGKVLQQQQPAGTLSKQAAQQQQHTTTELAQDKLLTGLAMTAMANRASDHVVRHTLAPLLVELIGAHLRQQLIPQHTCHRHPAPRPDSTPTQPPPSLWHVVNRLARDPPVHLLPGQPVHASRVQYGVLLDQGVVSRYMKRHLTPARCVVVTDHLLPLPTTMGQQQHGTHTVVVTSSQAYLHATAHVHHVLDRFLSFLSSCGVNLLLCSKHCSEAAVQACLNHGISLVSHVSDDLISATCDAAGITPVTSIPAALAAGRDDLLQHHVGHVDTARETVVAGAAGASQHRQGLLLEFHHKAAHIVLTGPSHGICREYYHMLSDALRLIASGRAAETHMPRPHHTQEQGPTCNRQQQPQQPHQDTCDNDLLPDVATALPAACDLKQHSSHTASAHVMCELPCVPGGLQFDAALSRALATVRAVAQQGGHPVSSPATQVGADIGDTCPSQQLPCSQWPTKVPASELFPALAVLHAMAASCPQAMVRNCLSGGRDAGEGARYEACSAQHVLHQLLTPPTQAAAALHPDAVASATSCGGAVSVQQGALQDAAGAGLVCAALACKRRPRYLGHKTLDVQHNATRDPHALYVGQPCVHGIIEPMSHVVGIWTAATELVLQLLRVDALVAARSTQPDTRILTQQASDKARVRKGAHAICSDSDASGADDTDTD